MKNFSQNERLKIVRADLVKLSTIKMMDEQKCFIENNNIHQ